MTCTIVGCTKPEFKFARCAAHARQLVREKMAVPMTRCFPSVGDYDDYVDAWVRSVKGASIADACADCTVAFRDAMIDEGRCDHPETTFVRTADGETVGVSAVEPIRWLRAISNQGGVTVTGPCTVEDRRDTQEAIWAAFGEIRKTTGFSPDEGEELEPVRTPSGPKPAGSGGLVPLEGSDGLPPLHSWQGVPRSGDLVEPAHAVG